MSKNIGCTNLVGKLFTLNMLDSVFVASFVDKLVGSNEIEAYECLFYLMASPSGKQFVQQQQQNGNDKQWWQSFFERLINLEGEKSVSRIKTIAVEILTEITVCLTNLREPP